MFGLYPTTAHKSTPADAEQTSDIDKNNASETECVEGGLLPQPTVFYLDHEIGDYLDPQPESLSSNDFTNLPVPRKPTYAEVADPLYHIATIPPADRVSSAEPCTKTLSHGLLQKSIGFRMVDSVLKRMKDLAKPTIAMCNTGTDPLLSRGETATLLKKE